MPQEKPEREASFGKKKVCGFESHEDPHTRGHVAVYFI